MVPNHGIAPIAAGAAQGHTGRWLRKNMKENGNRFGRITIFPLLMVSIVALIVAQIGRFVFARQIVDWETRTVQALGLNVVVYRVGCGLLFFVVLIAAYIRVKRKRKMADVGQFILPGERR